MYNPSVRFPRRVCDINTQQRTPPPIPERFIFHVRIAGQSIGNPLEDIGIASVTETTESGAAVAEHGRQIMPRTSRSDNPQHRFHKKPVVPTTSTQIHRFAKALGSISAHWASVSTKRSIRSLNHNSSLMCFPTNLKPVQPGQKTTIRSSKRDFDDEHTLRNLAPLALTALTISGAGCFHVLWIG